MATETRQQELLAELERRKNPEPNAINQLGPSGTDIRSQELVEELRSRGIPTNEPNVILPPEDSFDRNREIQKLSKEGISHQELMTNTSLYQFNPEIVNKIGFKESLKRTDKLQLLPFVGSLYKTEQLLDVIYAAQRLGQPDGVMTDDLSRPLYLGRETIGSPIRYSKVPVDSLRKQDLATIEKWIIKLDEEQERGFSIGGRIAQGIAELPAFMVEFLLTGPIFKVGSVAGKKAATKILGRFAEKGVGKMAVRVAGAGFGSLLRTSVNMPRVFAGTVEDMTKGIQITDDGAVAFSDAEVNPFKSLARSFADLYIENLTEVAGEAIGETTKLVGGKLAKQFPVLTKYTQALADKWIANAPSGVTRTVSGFLKASATKVGYDGILQEMAEERLGDVLRSATGLQSWSDMIPSMEDLLVEAGIFTVPGGVSLATNKIFRKDIIPEDIEIEREVIAGTELGDDILATKEEVETPIDFEAIERVRQGLPPQPQAEKDTVTGAEAIQQPETNLSPKEQKVKDTTVKTKSDADTASAKNASVQAFSTIDAIRRNVARVEDALAHWGSVGRKVQQELRDISRRTNINVGNTTQNIRRILKGTSAKDRVLISQMVDNAIPIEGQPIRLRARASLLRKQLDFIQTEAQKVGLRKKKLSGRAFPQILNDKGKAFIQEAETKGATSHRVFAWAQNKVKEGKFKTVDSAIAALQNYRKNRLRGTESYLEGTRTLELDLDMREWNPEKVLPSIIEGGWENIEGARQWGVTKDGNFKSIRTSIERVRSEVGIDQARLLEDYIKAQYGQSRASVVAKRWSRRVRAVQFVGKIAISPLTITRNMLDRYAKGLTHGTLWTNIRATVKFPPFLNEWMKSSRKIQDEMIRNGAVLGHGSLSEGFASGGQISQFIGKPFAMSERGNQTYIALVKKIQLESDLQRLHEMGGEQGTIGKFYDRMLNIVGKSQSQIEKRVLQDLTNEQLADTFASDKVSDDVVSEVLHRTVVDSAFPLTLASKRMWWGNKPWLQAMTQFKVWPADQIRFIYKDVLKYTLATGDPSRMTRFILSTWMAGELYNIARDFLTDRDESLLSTLKDEDGRNVKAIAKSMGGSLLDGGIVGMFADLTYGLTDWVAGPTIASIRSATEGVIATSVDPANAKSGFKKFILEDVPAAKQVRGLLDRIDRTFYNKEENLTADYAKWRQRGFEFRRETGDLTEAERIASRIFLGRSRRLPGPRSLSLEMTARQVLVGDFNDAAQYIKGIIRDTPVEKLKDVISAINTSARNLSPFGNISKEKLPLFLSKMSVKGQAEGIKLQIKWMEGYKKATDIAIKELISEGFEEEVKVRAENFKKEIQPQIEKFTSTIKELRGLLK